MRQIVGQFAAVGAACMVVTEPSAAKAADAAPAAGLELSASTDSDHTDVIKLLGRGLWSFEGRDKYQGIAIERAWFTPVGEHTRKETRAYIDLADGIDDKWKWRARIGTDGHTVLGSAGLRTSDWSRELFLEREVVETRRGLDEGIYYTFGGASIDIPAGARDTFNVMGGVQEFTGKNVRLHLRGSAVHVIAPKLGLSAQLRTRCFHSTRPQEFDYYSPRNFVQVLPVVQMRRFTPSGWMILGALGLGAQKATGAGWQSARLADLRIESPARSNRLQAFLQVQYSNNSLNQGGGGYYYVAARAGLTAQLR
jgi:hypothetical protein